MKLINENINDNDHDDLYAIYYPMVGKRIVDKDKMIKILEEYIRRIKEGGMMIVGEGFAFRNIQAIAYDKPYVPNKDDDEFLKSLTYKD